MRRRPIVEETATGSHLGSQNLTHFHSNTVPIFISWIHDYECGCARKPAVWQLGSDEKSGYESRMWPPQSKSSSKVSLPVIIWIDMILFGLFAFDSTGHWDYRVGLAAQRVPPARDGHSIDSNRKVPVRYAPNHSPRTPKHGTLSANRFGEGMRGCLAGEDSVLAEPKTVCLRFEANYFFHQVCKISTWGWLIHSWQYGSSCTWATGPTSRNWFQNDCCPREKKKSYLFASRKMGGNYS
jgi:hypothetical protein